MDKFNKALLLAYDLHKDQKRKASNLPYISHLMAVSALSMECASRANMPEIITDVAIAGLLHDAIEDQGDKITLPEIEAMFGLQVKIIVADCSDAIISKENKTKPAWEKRKQDYINAIYHKEKPSLIVSIADKLHNAKSIIRDRNIIGEEIWNRFSAKKEQTLWYYSSLTEAFYKTWDKNPLLPEFEIAVKELFL